MKRENISLTIMNELKEELLSMNIGDSFFSEREICEKFKVSRMTANKVLNQLNAEGLVRRERGRGTFVTQTTQNSFSVKCIFPNMLYRDSSEEYFNQIFSGGLELASQNNHLLVPYVIKTPQKYNNIDRQAIDFLSCKDKVILPYYHLHRDDFFDAFTARKCQTVFIYRQMQMDIIFKQYYRYYHTVLLDRFQAMQNVIGLLSSQKRKRIAFINNVSHPEAPLIKGYLTGLQKYKKTFYPELTITAPASMEASYNACMQLIMCRKVWPFDAIVTMFPDQALGALQALSDANITVPEQVSVISFGDNLALKNNIQPVSAVDMCYYQAGEMAWEIHAKNKFMPGEINTIVPQIVERGTT